MSVAAYPAYKDSGVEWIGSIPTTWQWKRFRFVFSESGAKIDGEVFGGMLSVSGYRGIEVKEYDDENRRRLESELQGYRIVRVGQLVINTMWMNYAGLGVSEFDGHVSPAYRAYDVSGEIDRRYAHHLLRSEMYVRGYTGYLTGIRPNSLQMSREDLMDFPVLLPPMSEQRAIAAFLDHETAKIDALVAEQERLMALLKEKRQAVISQAVTKGLDPNAPMKNSGVAWLGEAPAHWEIRRIGVLFGEAIEDGEHDLPVLSVSIHDGVSDRELADEELERKVSRSEDRTKYKKVQPGGLVYNMMRAWQGGFGTVTVQGMVSPAYVVARLKAPVRTEFIELLLRTPCAVDEMRRHSRGVTDFRLRLYWDEFKQIRVALPSLDEQDRILRAIAETMSHGDTLTAQASRAITLLRERRAALISAAVTGKIDVRQLAPTKQDAA